MADTGTTLIPMFGPLVFLLVVAGIIYWLFKAGHSNRETDAAIEELHRQYAQGEIDDEEFDTRREKLRQYR